MSLHDIIRRSVEYFLCKFFWLYFIMATPVTYTIAGYHYCGYFESAKSDAEALKAKHPEVSVEVIAYPRSEYKSWLQTKLEGTGIRHTTSPAVWKGTPEEGTFIGGASEFRDYIKSEYKSVEVGSTCSIM